ncbi:class D beta-lactamase [Neorhizobium lilium]|uniref:beta-lactamase n=1 Tax=Neorhizobium lilium TaxID=2503024 RepID=A0A444LDV8_9HYPH|nr:class D beta-lactamase [Neorhizobium lilium]RWX75989.1 class D beta-lactamase [Neorhizobium lilium]
MTPRRFFLGSFIAVAVANFVAPAAAWAADPLRCTVIIDAKTGERLYRQGDCDKPVYPQSTFKLALAMMAYDAGILKSEHEPLWKYQAKFNRSAREQKDTDPVIWERDSIVWYSQELTRKLGRKSFTDYVQRFGYGNRDVTGGPGKADGLTHAWLMSSLKISPDEQVSFLRRFLNRELHISKTAMDMTMAIVPHFVGVDGWDIQGKTGSGSQRDKAGNADSSRPIGWFVGWATKGDRRLVFARLLVDTKPYHDTPISYVVRDSLVADLPLLAKGF